MLFDPPDRHLLLDSVIAYFERNLRAHVPEGEVFQFRVALNLLKILARELRAAPRTAAIESRIRSFLGSGEGDPVRDLADAIRDGRVSTEDPALLDLLRSLAEHALDVDQPRYPGRMALDGAHPPVRPEEPRR